MINLPGWQHQASSVSPDRRSCVFRTSPRPSLWKSHPGSWRCRTGPLVGWWRSPGHVHCLDGTLWENQVGIFSFTITSVNCRVCVCWLLWVQCAGQLTWRRASSSKGLQETTGKSCGRSLDLGLAAVAGQSELAYGGQTGCPLPLWSLLEVD